MILKKSMLCAAGALILSAALPTAAQYQGPRSAPRVNLAEILVDPIDDERVILQGFLTRKIRGDVYLFSDGEFEIRVEIDQFVFPSQPFDESDLIEIEGEVDKDFLEPLEIDVERLTVF